MKLELKHIAPYLPYGLNFIMLDPSGEYEISPIINIDFAKEELEVSATCYDFSDLGGEEIKPILRPLLDLTREELYKAGFNSHIDYLTHEHQEFSTDVLKAPYDMVVYLFEHHFDVFGLIEKGLAVNINDIKGQ